MQSDAAARAGPELSIPGNSFRSEPHRVVGSVNPPRHWRTKAKAARVSGNTVSIKRSLEVKEDDDEVGLRPAIDDQRECKV